MWFSLVDWCLEPSQPLGTSSGLKETFIKRYTVERTNKAKIRPEEQSQKTKSCRENLWNEIQLKGPYRQKQTQEQNKKEWASLVGLSQTKTVTYPPREGEPAGTANVGNATTPVRACATQTYHLPRTIKCYYPYGCKE